MAKENVKFPERISVPMTERMAKQIRSYAEADGDRSAASWIRVHLENLLEQLSDGKAKK